MIAALHLIGALLSMLVLSTVLYFVGVWFEQKNSARVLRDASVDLGRPVAELETPEFEAELLRYFATKYSDDLLRNRLSDLFGSLLTVFNWLVLLTEIVVLGSVAWFSFKDDQSNAVYAWLVLGVVLLAFAVAFCVVVLCKILTGRFPGQARQARKALGDAINRATRPVA